MTTACWSVLTASAEVLQDWQEWLATVEPQDDYQEMVLATLQELIDGSIVPTPWMVGQRADLTRAMRHAG
jgi:hypothetical protein